MRLYRALGLCVFLGQAAQGLAGYQQFSRGPVSVAVPPPYVLSRLDSNADEECFTISSSAETNPAAWGSVCFYPRFNENDRQGLGFVERNHPVRYIRTPIGSGVLARDVACAWPDMQDEGGVDQASRTCHTVLILGRSADWAVVIHVLARTPQRTWFSDAALQKLISGLSLRQGASPQRAPLGR